MEMTAREILSIHLLDLPAAQERQSPAFDACRCQVLIYLNSRDLIDLDRIL
jgi:hypothetical protein